MELKLNREYALRHLFVTALMLGLAAWFGYDAYVRYPSMPARELYVAIERAEPPAETALVLFKKQKIRSQQGFALLSLAAAALVGRGLWKAARFRFGFDDRGFTAGTRRYGYDEIRSLDDRAWAKKGVTKVVLADRTIVLDAWHHTGVKEFHDQAVSSGIF